MARSRAQKDILKLTTIDLGWKSSNYDTLHGILIINQRLEKKYYHHKH